MGRNFKNLSPDLESAPPRYHKNQFSVEMDNFYFFDLNLGKLPSYVRYFGSNNVRELGGGWNELVEGGWRKVELGASGWKWVHGLVIPFLYSMMNKLLKLFGFWLAQCRSNPPQVFLGKGIPKICSKFAPKQPCQHVILWRGSYPEKLLLIFRTPFLKNTSGEQLLTMLHLSHSLKNQVHFFWL